MRAPSILLLLAALAVVLAGCGDAVSTKDKDKTASKFKELNKNDKDGIATP